LCTHLPVRTGSSGEEECLALGATSAPLQRQRESLDASDCIAAPSRPGSLRFHRFWLISSINVVKDVLEGTGIRGVCILIKNRSEYEISHLLLNSGVDLQSSSSS